jgi:hypothetical protein
MTADEWAAFCMEAQQHKLQSLLMPGASQEEDEPAAAGPGSAAGGEASAYSHAPGGRHAAGATTSSMPQYEALVFSGGGARCLAYVGAVHRLRELVSPASSASVLRCRLVATRAQASNPLAPLLDHPPPLAPRVPLSQGMLRNLRAVAGSSGGAVFAVLTALKITPQQAGPPPTRAQAPCNSHAATCSPTPATASCSPQ